MNRRTDIIRWWRNLWYIRLLLLVSLCFACEKELLDLPPIIPEGNTPIRFSKSTTQTKGQTVEGNTLPTGSTVGVLAFYLPGSNADNPGQWSHEALPNFMYNQLMTVGESGSLTYSPIKYWPGNPNDKIRFFAYAPHSSNAKGNGIALSDASSGGYPTISYTPNLEASSQVDLLVAATDPLNSGSVNLAFKHALTQVTFSVKILNANLIQNIKINSITLEGVANGNGVFTDSGFEWKAAEITQDYVLTINKELTGAELANEAVISLSADTPLLLVPQDATNCTLTVTLSVTEAGLVATEHTITPALPSAVWEMGKKINYLLTIDANNLLAEGV